MEENNALEDPVKRSDGISGKQKNSPALEEHSISESSVFVFCFALIYTDKYRGSVSFFCFRTVNSSRVAYAANHDGVYVSPWNDLGIQISSLGLGPYSLCAYTIQLAIET